MNRSRSEASRGGTASRSLEIDTLDRSSTDLRFWVDCLGAPVLVVEKHSPGIRFANSTAQAFFLMGPEDDQTLALKDVLGAEAEQLLGQVWSSSAVGSVGEPFIIRCMVGDQSRPLMVRATKVVVEGEMLQLFTFTDAPPQGSVAMAGWQDNMMEILNWFPFGFEIADHEDQIQFANAHCKRLFGYEQHQLETAEEWWTRAYPDPEYRKYAKAKWETEIEAARREDREMTPFDLDVTTLSGEMRTIQFRHRTIDAFNVNLFVDVTRERRYERELKLLAGTDPLTGVMNRRRFFEEVPLAFKHGNCAAASLLMLDIDHFKGVNDTYGHASGDVVLQEVTRRCGQVLRGMDIFARFGGEEFAILLPDTPLPAAEAVADLLRNFICDRPIAIPGSEIHVTASMGLTACADGEDIDASISRADKALYEAKRLGRNRVVVV